MSQRHDRTPDLSRRSFLGLAAAGAGLPLLAPLRAASARPKPRRDEWSVCIFSKHLQFLDYEAMAAAAAAIGVDGVDLTVRPGGHVLPERVEEQLPRAVEAVRRAGLTVPMMTTAITDPRDPLTEPILRTASELGIGYYRLGYFRYEDEREVAETLEAYAPQLEALAEMNRHYGIHGAYQNHAGSHYVGAPVWDLHHLLDPLDPRWLGVQYDIRHATVEGGQAWPLGLKLLAPYIKTIVAKDFVWAQDDTGRWRVRNVPVGQGMVDFGAYFDLLDRLGISGPISLHVEYPLPGEHGEALATAERTRQTIPLVQRDVEALRIFLAQQ